MGRGGGAGAGAGGAGAGGGGKGVPLYRLKLPYAVVLGLLLVNVGWIFPLHGSFAGLPLHIHPTRSLVATTNNNNPLRDQQQHNSLSTANADISSKLQRHERQIQEQAGGGGEEGSIVVVESLVNNLENGALVNSDEEERQHGGKSLPSKLKLLLARLKSSHAILTGPRLGMRGSISCGGSGAVSWRLWMGLIKLVPNIAQALLRRAAPLADVVAAVSGSCLADRRGGHDCDADLEDMLDAMEVARKGDTHKGRSGGEEREEEEENERVYTCAVVGNAGSLRNASFGSLIDSKDVVIRFNQGRTKGFERQASPTKRVDSVGRKSTIRLYNGPYVEPKQPGEITIAQMRDPAMRSWVNQKSKHPLDVAFMFDLEFLCMAWDAVDRAGQRPSSGLVGVMLALHLCIAPIDVFGYNSELYFNNQTQPHYYDWERPKPGREDVHPFKQELELYKTLEQVGLLKLHR
eukprot:jgi/Chlat1/6366/Chrsp44S05755